MWRYLTVFCFLFLSGILYAQSITGKWTSYKKGVAQSVVEIYETNNVYFGKILEVINPPDGNMNPLCTKCKGANKNQPIVGMVIINNMVKTGNNYSKGTILNPDNGKVYSLQLSLADNDPNTLVVKGLLGPFSQTQYWKRVR